MITQHLRKFAPILPQSCRTDWQQLFADTVDNPRPLRICLTGDNGLGKTSLINMLLGEPLLPIGKAALPIPVYLIFGEQLAVHIFDAEGQATPITPNTLPKAQAELPANCHRLTITAPHTWLQDIELVDIPREYEDAAQCYDKADGLVQLVNISGPKESDMELIQQASQNGQHVITGVARWDEVEADASRNQHSLPDLQALEDQLQKVTGQEIAVVPVSHNGTGQFALITFLQNLARRRNEIREQRLQQVGMPMLLSCVEALQQECETLRQENEALQQTQTPQAKMKTSGDGSMVIKLLYFLVGVALTAFLLLIVL